MDVVETVEQLVALSSSPYEEEARSAAFKACQLMRQHGLVVMRPGPPPPPPLEDEGDEGGMIAITSKFDGRCKGCGRTYHVGAPLRWTPSRGCLCLACFAAGKRL